MEYSKVYSFILSTPENLIDKVKRLKAFCAELIGPFASEHSKAHITISNPILQAPNVMANICKRLIQDLSYVPSFMVVINGYGNFKNSSGYVIYAKIELDETTNKSFKTLKSNFDNESSFIPHITIARGLSLQQFEILWPYFHSMEYRQSFRVDSVLILENEIVKTGHDQLFKKIALGSSNLPPRTPWTLFDNISPR